MSDKHLSTQFDADLNAISTKLLQIGAVWSSRRSKSPCGRYRSSMPISPTR
ncbi:hypothetical protein ACU4GD_33360 [Cupriavidus basilensis]